MKGNVGPYMQSEGSGFAATYNPLVFDTDTRTWTDTNRDDIAQESELGPTSNRTFGVRRNRNPDPDIRRPYQVVYDFGVQRELRPGMALSVSYNKRSYHEIHLDGQPRHRAVQLHSVYRPGPDGPTMPAKRCRCTAWAGPATASSGR